MAAPRVGFSPFKGPDRVSGRSGLVLAYIANAAVVNVSTIPTTTMQLTLTTTSVSNALAGIELQGSSTGICDLHVDVIHNSALAISFVTQLPSGNFTLGIPFVLRNIPTEVGNWSLRLYTSSNSVSLPIGGSSWWIESGAIVGGLIATDPSSTVLEPVTSDSAPTDATTATFPDTSSAASVTEAVSLSAVAVADVVSLLFGGQVAPAASADDGYYSAATFNTSSTVVRVGNSAGDIRGAFIRWTLPVDLAGRTILSAQVTLVPDNTLSSPVQILMTADLSGVSAQVVSPADRASRTVTTAFLASSVIPSAGSAINYNVLSLLQEIASTAPATFGVFQLFLDDNGSGTDVEGLFRSVDHATITHRPQLTVTYT